MSFEPIVATSTLETLHAITSALDDHRPIALFPAQHELDRQRATLAAAEPDSDDALVLFTSGSTGGSRGVVHTHTSVAAISAASRLELRADDRWLAALPLARAGGVAVAIRCHAANVAVELVADAEPLAAALARSTIASLVPTQLAQLLDDPRWRSPPNLRAVLLGGAPAPRSLIAAALDRDVPVHETYGLTETLGLVATAATPGGTLVALPGVQLTAGTAHEPAPIRIRAPMLARRYLDGDAIAPELVTSDLGWVDDAGSLHVTGRADDVIVTGGHKVHPTEVEAVLAATAGVRAACVFGIADARWGQIVGAAIAVTPRFDRIAAARSWHELLPPHARPRQLAIAAALPVLAGAKIDRRAAAALPADVVRY